MPDRLTAAEVRELLVGAGWIPWEDNTHVSPDDTASLLATDKEVIIETLSGSYQGLPPSTPSDLWALLRCVGAPVPERRKENRPELIPCNVPTCREIPKGMHSGCMVCGALLVEHGLDTWRIIMGRRREDWDKEVSRA